MSCSLHLTLVHLIQMAAFFISMEEFKHMYFKTLNSRYEILGQLKNA